MDNPALPLSPSTSPVVSRKVRASSDASFEGISGTPSQNTRSLVRPHTTRGGYHPVVTSMVRSNTMKDCVQVRDMYTMCNQHQNQYDEDSFVCRTAKRYHDLCQGGK